MSSSSLIQSADLGLLEPLLATDLARALTAAIECGSVLGARSVDAAFRRAVGAAIRDIETDPRGELFQRFLTKGPYWSAGSIPTVDAEKCLSDDEVSTAIKFIYSFMVNSFQGCLAEVLALGPCLEIMRDAIPSEALPGNARLYALDTVTAMAAGRAGAVQCADLHILIEDRTTEQSVSVVGVVEVKSYARSWPGLGTQLDKHCAAARRGLRVEGAVYSDTSVRLGFDARGKPLRIGVVPGTWLLPRTFRFVEAEHGRVLRADDGAPPTASDAITRLGDLDWHVTLRWSKEALAAAAYELTFWYMAKVGEVVYRQGVPADWSSMTPAEAGRNAAKMMLYYAILRARTWHEEQRAIALYNAYGFGYALGTSFKNEEGSREMLWFEDLEEILANGVTKHRCRLTCAPR